MEKDKLTDEEKERLICEVVHYIAMGCYDFTVKVGGVTVESRED